MIYPFTFLLSIVLIIVAYIMPRKSILRKAFIIASVLPPCLVAAARDVTIGTDVQVYVQNWFKLAVHENNFFNYLQLINTPDLLYALLTFLVARLSSDICILFFITQLLTIAPIYFVLYKTTTRRGLIIGSIIYFLFFYNTSLNLVRQSISLSFSLLSFYYLSKRDIRKYSLLTVAATLFHFSGILGILYYITYRVKGKKFDKVLLAIVSVIILTAITFFPKVIIFLNSIDILPDRFLVYTTKFLRSGIQIDYIRELYYLLILIVTFLLGKKNDRWIIILTVIGFLCFQLGLVSNFAYRVSYIFFYPTLFVLIPSRLGEKTITKNQLLILFILISCMSLYWVQQIIILKVHETFPYKTLTTINSHNLEIT